MKWLALGIVVLIAVLYVSFPLGSSAFPQGSSGNYDGEKFGELRRTPNGLQYRIVEIEGKRFVAIQGNNGYWNLTGPIDCPHCGKSKSMEK